MRPFAVGLFLFPLTVVACSGGDFDVAGNADDAGAQDGSADASDDTPSAVDSGSDETAPDSTVADSTVTDSTVADATLPDSTLPDSLVVDAKVPDASGIDAPADTKPSDAASSDGQAPDARAQDAATDVREGGVDAGTGTDTGTIACPGPPSTATIDTSLLTCEQLELKYTSLLQDAQECQCDGECGTTIATDFCANCTAAVNTATDAYAKMVILRDAWDKRVAQGSCDAKTCTDVVCPLPTTGTCSAQLIGKTCKNFSVSQ